MSEYTTRICNTCNEDYPLTSDNFYKDSRYKGGYRPQCKYCCRKKQKEWQQENLDEYRRKKREYARSYYWRNPEKCRERSRDYSKGFRSKVRESERRYRENNRERVRAWQRDFFDQNPNYQKVRYHRNIEESRSYGRVKRRSYRARKRSANGKHTPADVKRIYRDQKGLCAYCKAELNNSFHVDHIVPLSRGGSDSPDNICCACAFCNQSKHGKLVHEWEAVRGW